LLTKQKNIEYWVTLCKEGNEEGFAQIYQSFSRQMFSVAVRILQDREEAEDILQESFIMAFGKINSFRGDATFGSWLKRIVVNKAINQIKKRKLYFEEIGENESLSDDEVIEYPTLSTKEIQEGIDELPNGYRAVISLFLLEGYSHKEIAEEMEISESTSKTQYKRAKLRLRDILNKKIISV